MRGLAADDVADLDGGADRHGALVDDDLVAVHRAGDLAGDAKHVLQVGGAVLAGRRADGDEDDLRLRGRRAPERGREGQALLALVPPDHLLEPGLVDGDLAPLQHPDLGRVLVDADDLVAVLGEAGAGNQPDVSAPNHRYLHSPVPPDGHKTLRLAQPKKTVNLLTAKDLAAH